MIGKSPSDSQNYPDKLVKAMKRDQLMRKGERKKSPATWELGCEQTEEELRIDQRFLNQGTKISFISNDWANKMSMPLSEMNDELLYVTFLEKLNHWWKEQLT